jgi:carotenoid cleavage dioxygenase
MGGGRFPFRWNPDHGARVGLLPREGEADDVEWFDVELCYVYHPLNAWEEDDGRVVVDVVRHPSQFHTHLQGPLEQPTTLDRWTIDRAAGKVLEERLDDHPVELPRADERRTGRRNRYGYSIELPLDGPTRHAYKYDLVTGGTEVHDFGPQRETGELVFVARSDDADEDDGWLLSWVYDAETDRSDVMILHAQDFTGDPVATIHLPRRVPYGFHGNWLPDD